MEFLKKNKKIILIVFGVLVALGLIIAVIIIYRDSQVYVIPPYKPKSTEDVCSLNSDISRSEVIRKMTDSVFGEDYNEPSFKKNPITYYEASRYKFTNSTIEKSSPMYSVGYTVDILMGSYLSGVYHNDDRYTGIFKVSSEYLYANAYPYSVEADYWHMNSDSICYPLFFKDYLDENTVDVLSKVCEDSYYNDFLMKYDNQGSLCPMQYENVDFLKGLVDIVVDKKGDFDSQYYIDNFSLYTEGHAGKAKDYLYLFENIEQSYGNCQKDAYFRLVANHLLYLIKLNEADGATKTDVLELLSSISYGIKSIALSNDEKSTLEYLKKRLLDFLPQSNSSFGQTVDPYGALETSYVEICIMDKDFFKDMDIDEPIFSIFTKDCDFENKLLHELIDRSCELTSGDEVMLFSPVYTDGNNDKIAFASLPYSSKMLTFLILLELME